jgi:hypothetical protein
MKVVVRSSSLLFTLLSIVLHVPIQRVKRRGAESAPAAGRDSSRAAEIPRVPPQKEVLVVTGSRRDRA